MEQENSIEIKYRKPATWKKFMARFIDAIVFAILFGALFIPTRAIVTSSNRYKTANTLIENEQINSGLYKKNKNGMIIDLITFYNQDTYISIGNKIKNLDEEIDFFINEYAVNKMDPSKYENLKTDRKEFFLNDKFIFDGQKYFIEQDGKIIRNPECTADSKKYFDNVYSDYFDLHLQGYFTKNINGVFEQYKILNNKKLYIKWKRILQKVKKALLENTL